MSKQQIKEKLFLADQPMMETWVALISTTIMTKKNNKNTN